MKLARCAMIGGGIIVVLLLLGMKSHSPPEISLLGPEVGGLRMGLRITTRNIKGKDTYDVRIRILNAGSQPVTLVGPPAYEGKSNNYAEWLKAEMCFITFPEILPPSAQTGGPMRTSPNPQTTIRPGEEFTVSWSSQGRYLKSEDYHNTTPYFPSDGLYGVRARVLLRTKEGQEILLHSNEQAVCVGGSVALPKYGVALVWRRDEEKQQVVLSLGSRHRIAKGDRFRVPGRFPSGWMLTVTEVNISSSRATVERTGPYKDDMEPLPPKSARAQLWEFGRRNEARQPSAEKDEFLYVGMTRREMEKAYQRDGGIFSPFEGERYVLSNQPADGPEGNVLKVKVRFRPANMSEKVFRDAKRYREWMAENRTEYGSKSDIVAGISAPYWEPPYFD